MMKTAALVLVTAMVPVIMGNNGGCSEMPSVAQIELNIPASMRNCPYAPKSPGAKASNAQRAVYISGLYYAWKRCYNDNKAIDALYQKYRVRIDAAARGGDN